MHTHRLRGNRDDLTALHWSNLLVVEQGFSSAPPIHKINAPLGRVYFLADGEGFEPPVELPPQRFSRPSQSTALPPIRNYFFRRSFKPAVLFAFRTWARVTWHILHKFFTNAIAKYFVTAFYMPMRFLYDTVILYPYIHAYNRPK